MPNGPNDTDPQSPRALANRTDPGLGGDPAVLGPRARTSLSATPPPAVPTPSPGSASIEELLDGITGPRPAPARRDAAPGSTRAYAAARHAPTSQRMPPQEPLVVSPVPPPAYDASGGSFEAYAGRELAAAPVDEERTAKVDPASTRPVVKRGEERTVYTGRRALVRNLAVALGSSVVVALTMLTVMRWKEAQRPTVSVVVVPPLPSLDDTHPASEVPSVTTDVIPAALETSVAAATPAPALAPLSPTTMSEHEATSAKPAPTVAKRPKSTPKPSPSPDALDDLNRQIRH